MTDELERHVLKKYDISTKLGKGVRVSPPALPARCARALALPLAWPP